LQGAGGVTLALPFLHKFMDPKLASANGELLPQRILTMTYAMGFVAERWRPSASGSSFTFPYITAPLTPFQDRTLVVSNCDHKALQLNENHTWGHPAKQEAALTGTLMTGAFGGDGSNRVENVLSTGGAEGFGPANESVEQFIGSRLRTPSHVRQSVDLAVSGRPEYEPNEVASTFCFEARSNPVTLQANPARAFNDLFAGISATGMEDPALRALRERNKSVLDAVRDSFVDLRSGLDRRDQTILDDHAARIRQIELDVMRVACSPPAGIPTDGSAMPDASLFRGMSMSELAPLQTRIMAHAMGCNLAPIGRIEFTDQHDPLFGIPNVDDEVARWRAADDAAAWHSLVHGEVSPVDGVPTRPNETFPDAFSPALLDGYRFFVQQYANLLDELDQIVEGPDGRTALDNSLVVLATDFGNGNGHGCMKMGYIMAGNTGPARRGYHLDCAPGANFYAESTYSVSQLLVSMIQMFCLTNPDGSLIDEFGLQGFSRGPIDALFT
jgi:hypothetical protein